MNSSNKTNTTETTDQTETQKTGGIAKKNVRFWIEQIQAAQDESAQYRKVGEEAYLEYEYAKAAKDNYKWDAARNQHFSLFWSSIQTLGPAIYSQTPTAMLKRRFDDKDDIGRVASLLGERFLRTLVDESPFDNVMNRAVQDYLVTGMGVTRVRYIEDTPKLDRVYLQEGEPIPEGTEVQEDEVGQYIEVPSNQDAGNIEPEWIPWDSYLHTPGARAIEQVWWTGYIDYFDKDTFKERFGETVDIAKVNFRYTSRKSDAENPEQDDSDDTKDKGEFAKVIEVWDDRDKKVLWICPDYKEGFLDEQDDIYDLKEFKPSPQPLLGTIGNKILYPIAEYLQIRNLLGMMDFLSNRIWRLTKALRAAGVYDQDQIELKRLARETDDADLIPVENWISLIEKGGVNAVIQWADNSHIANSLMSAYQAFDRQKELVYEVTGNSDIMRGAAKASESATATATKDKFVGIRQSKRSQAVQNMARDLIELMADLAFASFTDDTILQMADAQFLAQEDLPLVPQALALLRSDRFRTFRIVIETDSTIAINSDMEKAMRLELLDAIGSFTDKVAMMADQVPEAMPMMMDVALYAVRGLKQSASLESSIESAFDAIKTGQEERAQQEPPPDPKMIELEQKMQLEQAKLEADAMAEQNKMALEQGKQQIEREKQNLEAEIEAGRLELEQAKLVIEREKLQIEREKQDLEAERILLEADRDDEKLEVERMQAGQKPAKQIKFTPDGAVVEPILLGE